jgi:Asp-tRNA(Asn)/Glu-tRNA(Gln) amidotransferase A subunit family amidase
MADEPHEMNAAELSAAFEARVLSPVEVTEACLGRIEALDSGVNAFCHLDIPAIEAMARASEQRWMEGAPLSPLDGVPVAIKDLLLTKCWPN